MRAHEFITEHRLVFKKNNKTGGISMKWRCETGPRQGRTVPEVSQCSAAPDIKKSAKMKNTRKRTKVTQARKAKKTKRVNPMSKTAARLNKQMRRGLHESSTTLSQIYQNNFPDDDESFWNYVSNNDLDVPFDIQTIQSYKLEIILRSQYHVEHIDELYDIMDNYQKKLVNQYAKTDLSNEIIIIYDGKIIDGNHRALAAVKSGQPIKFIELDDTNEED